MKDLIEILSKRIQLAVIVIGVIMILIGASGKIPFTEEEWAVDGAFWKYTIAVFGIVLLLEGILGVWFYFRQEAFKNKVTQAKVQSSHLTDNNTGLEDKIIERIECEGTLCDTNLGDSEKIIQMPDERLWCYELKNVVIKRYKNNRLSLEYEALIQSPHDKSTEIYKSFGSGPFIDGVAHILYSFEKSKTGSPNWKGSMVLRMPKRGSIIGYWLTTNVNADNRFPIGRINLKRKV